MSIVTEKYISCDGCGYNAADVNRQSSGIEQRKALKAEGWHQVKGKDYCPTCVNNNLVMVAAAQEGCNHDR